MLGILNGLNAIDFSGLGEESHWWVPPIDITGIRAEESAADRTSGHTPASASWMSKLVAFPAAVAARGWTGAMTTQWNVRAPAENDPLGLQQEYRDAENDSFIKNFVSSKSPNYSTCPDGNCRVGSTQVAAPLFNQFSAAGRVAGSAVSRTAITAQQQGPSVIPSFPLWISGSSPAQQRAGPATSQYNASPTNWGLIALVGGGLVLTVLAIVLVSKGGG